MYNAYFGLIDAPFSIAPNPRYLYMSEQHREALAHLLYGIEIDGGFVLLTGDVGTGKTTVCRCLLEQIDSDVEIALILNPGLSENELINAICDELNVATAPLAGNKELIDALNQHLLHSHSQGRKTVVIIDEAQNLAINVLEQLRLLTNLETNERKLLQIILLGQPQLLDILHRPELEQLSQRITARFHLKPLSIGEVQQYVNHRLAVAGAKTTLIPASCIRIIHKQSRGVPRLINLICDRSLLGCYAQNKTELDDPTVRKASNEVLGTGQKNRISTITSSTSSTTMYIAAALLIGAAMTWALSYSRISDNPDVDQPALAKQILAPASVDSTDTVSEPDPQTESATGPKPELVPLATDNPTNILTKLTKPSKESTESLTALIGAGGQQSRQLSFRELFRIWGVTASDADLLEPCRAAKRYQLSCLERIGNLRELRHLNRPVIVRLRNQYDPAGYFLLVTALRESTSTVIKANRQLSFANDELLEFWTGHYTLFWRPPETYETPIQQGNSGRIVSTLADQLAIANGHNTSAFNPLFDESLDTLVRSTQLALGLIPDGVVGPRTWIQLNTVTRNDVPTLQQPGG